jgi:hypothetical protein
VLPDDPGESAQLFRFGSPGCLVVNTVGGLGESCEHPALARAPPTYTKDQFGVWAIRPIGKLLPLKVAVHNFGWLARHGMISIQML